MGSAHRLNAPYQAFRTADGYLNVAALTPVQWRSLCTVLDRPSLADDPRYRDNAARLAHRGALAADIEQALGGETTAYWVERLIDAGVPAGPILDLEQALADAHTHARQMVEYVEHPVAGRVRTLGFPVKFSGTPMRVRRPPPQLGEHSRDIRQEAGLEEA
jgi:crotonobetainyl-CoA:carnitine CoA-transferase CaiB-like acyl-CoA transferase